MGNTVQAAGKTVTDAGYAAGNGVTGGILHGYAAMKSLEDPVRKRYQSQANQHLKAARKQTSAALIGELRLTAIIKADISRPFDIKANVRTQCTATQGIAGMMASPVLGAYQSNITQSANAFLEEELKKIFDDLNRRVKQTLYVNDQRINRLIQELWDPQCIKGTFTQNDSMLLTMDKEAACTLISRSSRHLKGVLDKDMNPYLAHQVHADCAKRILSEVQTESDVANLVDKLQKTVNPPIQRFQTKIYYETQSEKCSKTRIPFLVQIVIDFNAAEVRVELFGIQTLLQLINTDLKRALQFGITEISRDVLNETLGRPLEVNQCTTRTLISAQYLGIYADVALRVQL